MPPELQKQVDELAEQAVDDWVEQKHAHEIVQDDDECGLCGFYPCRCDEPL